MTKYTLHYFGVYARGEPIRMLLTHAKADWEDNQFSMEQWPGLKASMPDG
jgi:glutathione S-transferase